MKVQTTKVFQHIDKAIDTGYDIISAQGSARSSKTYNIVLWLIIRCLRIPGTTVTISRKTLPALKGSVLRDFKEWMEKLGEWSDRNFNKTELFYSFPNGSWIEFFSCDNETKLRGRKRKILFVNEATELSYIEWQQLQLRTTELSIIDYNPSYTDEHWISDVNKDERVYHFITTYKDNPFLEPKIIEEIESLQHKNPSLWQIYGLGIQAVIEGLIFKNVEIVERIPDEVRAKGKAFIGMDFGFTNDPTAIVEVIEAGDTLYLDEICFRTEMLSSDIIHELKGQPRRKIIAESADPRLIQEIYRAGLNIHPVKKYPGSVEAGISKMQGYKIKITKRSTNVIKESRNYTYQQDKNGKWLNIPIDMWNHSMDAARYVVMNELMGGTPRPINRTRTSRIVH